MRVFFQIIMALAIAFAANAWFSLILPDSAAMVFAIAILAVALFGMISGSFRLNWLVFGGPILLSWPLGALGAQWIAGLSGSVISHDFAMALSWIVPIPVWHFSFALSEKRDTARDYGGLIVGSIMLYLAVSAALSIELMARAGASFGIMIACLATASQLLLPPELDRAMRWLAGAAGVAGLAYILRAAAGL